MRHHPHQSLTAALAVLATAIAGTAFAEGAVPGLRASPAKQGRPHKSPRRPKHRRAPVRSPSPAVTRAAIDREIRRLAPSLRVGKSDYSNTTNIANRAALADQASTADQASSATSATKAASAGSAPLASIAYKSSSDLLTPANSGLSGPPRAVAVACPEGHKVVGGGVALGDGSRAFVNDEGPVGQTGWKADAYLRNGATATSITVTAICVPVA